MNDVASAAGKMADELGHQTGPFKEFIKGILTVDNAYKAVGAVIMLAIFYGIYRLILKILKSIPDSKIKIINRKTVMRVIHYIFYVCCAMYILSLFGIKFTAIWGAAGVAGVAIGFAAQTSVSNIISGLFVLSEKAMKVGDFITVGDISGTVDMINLLSVQIHTPDNQMVRIPNSTIINSNLINISYHDNRRITIETDVDYNTDLQKAVDVMSKSTENCPLILKDPAPKVWISSFDDSGIGITLAVWCRKSDFIDARTQAYIAVSKAFNEAKIVIPYNRINVCTVHDPEAERVALGTE